MTTTFADVATGRIVWPLSEFPFTGKPRWKWMRKSQLRTEQRTDREYVRAMRRDRKLHARLPHFVVGGTIETPVCSVWIGTRHATDRQLRRFKQSMTVEAFERWRGWEIQHFVNREKAKAHLPVDGWL